MMNNYPNQTNISSFPAYSVNGSPDEDQSRRKKKRMIIVFSIAGAVILLAAIIVIAVVILSKKPDTGYEEYKAMTQVRLESDKAAFYTDDDAKAQFSVTLPSSMLNKEFVLRNANGKAEHSINTSKMKVNENGDLTYTFPLEIDTKSGGMQTFTASVGEYQSAELNVFVTPHITLDHILKSFEVGNDVTVYLRQKYPKEKDGEKLAKAAKAFLEKDERVGEVSVNGTDVYYSTVDSIAGMVRCGATATETGAAASSPKKSGKAADSSTGTKFSRESEILTAYAASDLNADGTHIDSGNTCSNGNVLILRPASGALPESDFDGNLADGAELVRETAAGDATDELTDDNAVRAILTGKLCDYGTIILHAPGQAEKDADGKVCNVTFLLYSITAQQPDEETEGAPVTMRKKVSQYAAMFYGKKKASALTDEQIGDFCSSFYGSAKDPSGWRLYSCWNVQEGQGSLAMSSRYLMNIYNGKTLDNAVVYFDTYSALGLVSFNEWMINHGAKLLLGYEKPIEGDATLKDFRDVFTQLTKGSESDDWRTQNPYESSGMLGDLLTGRIFNAEAKNAAPEMVYCGNPSFFYSGTGSICGKVLYKDEEAENEDERITPCEGATVTAYLWHNKQFLEQKKATTDSKGQFVIEDVRCGAYVLKIQDAKGSRQTVSLIADDASTDGGNVYLKKPPEIVELDVKDMPESLVDFLDRFTDGCYLPFDCENDYSHIMGCIMFSPSCIDWSIYPVTQPEWYDYYYDKPDPKKWAKQTGDYFVYDQESVKWVVTNIFNVSEEKIQEMNQNAENYYLQKGRYYHPQGGVGDTFTRFELVAVKFDGKRYYVDYNAVTDGIVLGMPEWDGEFQASYTAELELKTIDGKEYWSIYKAKQTASAENN